MHLYIYTSFYVYIYIIQKKSHLILIYNHFYFQSVSIMASAKLHLKYFMWEKYISIANYLVIILINEC